MKKLFLLALAAILLRGAEADVKALVEAARNAWAVPGVAVAIVKDDKPLYLAGHGVRESGKADPVTPHTAFQIASTTKAFTTTAMAMLVDEGKLGWDDPVRKHLDFFRLADPHADALVTARDLVTHRTGLQRHDALWVRTGLGREELIRRIGLAKPAAPFRGIYQYQNLMFTSAGEVVGRASGLGWDGFVQQRILIPLGMMDTSTAYADMLRHANMAMPHIKGKANPLQNYDNIGGAGTIASSVDDLSRWVRMQLAGGVFEGKRLVSEKHLLATHEPQMVIQRTAASREMQPEYTQSSYAMGWFVNHYRGEMLVMHSGSLSGYRALITMVPRLKLGIVILANENGTNMNEALTNTLLDEYLGLPKTRDWNAHMLQAVKNSEQKDVKEKQARIDARAKDTKPSLPLTAYVGAYREPAYGEVNVSLQDGKLRAEWLRSKGEMEYWHFDTWTIKANGSLSDATANFQLDDKGSPTRLLLLGQTFERH